MNIERTRLCERCLRELPEGKGMFFEIRADIVADPTPPILDDTLDSDQVRSEYERLVAALRKTSPLDAAEQVYRHRVWTLCNSCIEAWLEDPFGNA